MIWEKNLPIASAKSVMAEDPTRCLAFGGRIMTFWTRTSNWTLSFQAHQKALGIDTYFAVE
jgi:hypothetical protein